jgi:tRNA threonylcarbamoyladenosine biosynthesis protein TsaE
MRVSEKLDYVPQPPLLLLTCDSLHESATERLGAALAEVLPRGTVVGLIGPLGAGKTRLEQAVATALGVPPGTVTSPTIVLVNEYRGGRMPIFHFDTYRLKDDDEFLALGPEEYFEGEGVTFVEWADRFPRVLPSERIEISIDAAGETSRRITVAATSTELQHALARLPAGGLA